MIKTQQFFLIYFFCLLLPCTLFFVYLFLPFLPTSFINGECFHFIIHFVIILRVIQVFCSFLLLFFVFYLLLTILDQPLELHLNGGQSLDSSLLVETLNLVNQDEEKHFQVISIDTIDQEPQHLKFKLFFPIFLYQQYDQFDLF